MARSKFILLLTIALVLGAGVVVGRLWARLPVVNAPPDKHPSWVAKELDLSADQQKQMDAIWADARQKMGATFEQRRTLDKQRDQAIADLLSEPQKAAYEKIQSDFHQQRTDLERVREKLVKEADAKTLGLLNEEQQKRYRAIPRQPHDRGPRGITSTGPSTRPSPLHGDHSHDGH